YGEVATMLVQIDENSATLTPFGSVARHIPPNAPTAETKSWGELLRSVLSQKRSAAPCESPWTTNSTLLNVARWRLKMNNPQLKGIPALTSRLPQYSSGNFAIFAVIRRALSCAGTTLLRTEKLAAALCFLFCRPILAGTTI